MRTVRTTWQGVNLRNELFMMELDLRISTNSVVVEPVGDGLRAWSRRGGFLGFQRHGEELNVLTGSHGIPHIVATMQITSHRSLDAVIRPPTVRQMGRHTPKRHALPTARAWF